MSSCEARKLILVADDQAFIRSLLVSMLRELGYRTQESTDGDQTVQQLVLRPDAVILDQRMAGWTGLEILQQIRCGATPRPRDLPVLMLTGHADENIVRIAGELDVTALLSKPVSKAQLKARLDSALKAAPPLKPPSDYARVSVVEAECAAAPRRTSNAWILKDAVFPRKPSYVSAADMARRAGATARPAPEGNLHYSRIRPGMSLACDLYSDGGRLIVAAGLELSEEMVKRLAAICAENPDLRYLSVRPPKKTEATSG